MKRSLIILVGTCLVAAVLTNGRNLRVKATNSTPLQQESVNLNEGFLAHTTRGAGATVPLNFVVPSTN